MDPVDIFTINVSRWISCYCYSIFRVEPYNSCWFNCTYCYARWYRRGLELNIIRMWEKVCKRIARSSLKPFFRLATLTDPFQPREESIQASLRILRLCYHFDIPVIVNTRSNLICKSPWIDLLQCLADKRLVIVQLTIPFYCSQWILLEPKSPSPEERLEVISKLREHGIPVVARIQPLIPGLEECHLKAASEAIRAGALGIIGESLRETLNGLKKLSKLLGYDLLSQCSWEPYSSSSGGLLHPHREWRITIHRLLHNTVRGLGAHYSACKDEYYDWWSPGKDCCMAWLALNDYILRVTVYELAYTHTLSVKSAVEKLKGRYVHSEFQGLDRLVRRGLKRHEATMLRHWRLGRCGLFS